jgi:hypothetical protein
MTNGLHDLEIVVGFPAEGQMCLFSEVFLLTRRPTQPPIQWIHGGSVLGDKQTGA